MNALSKYRLVQNSLFALLGGLAMLAATPSHAAGSFRTYLSSTGNDSNAGCPVTAPCRLLPAALAATADAGEVWILDSANYNTGPVAIPQNVTILAIPGALASFVANNNYALLVSGNVTLRNISVRNFSGSSNIGILSIGNLTIEDSEISGLSDGVRANYGLLTIKNSTIRDNSYHGVWANGTLGDVNMHIDGSHLINNGQGITISENTSALISNSVVRTTTPSEQGIVLYAAGGGIVATLDHCQISGNAGYGVIVDSATTDYSASIAIHHSTIAHHDVGLQVGQSSSGNSVVHLDDVMFDSNNTSDIQVVGQHGTVVSAGNNGIQTITGASLQPANFR
jgi:hypothetical protein